MTAGATSVDTPGQMRGYAIQLATRFGFHVFPVDHPGTPRCRGVGKHHPDDCDERGKHPTCRWSQWSTTDVELLITARYFGGGEPRNIGVDCGKSRLLVIDEDAHDELARFCADHGVEMPATFTVRTASGFHHYFRLPDGVDLGNDEGTFHGYQINIRGVGGYVVAPGSRHATGVGYVAVGDVREIAPAPKWLTDAVTTKRASSTGDGAAGDGWWRTGEIPAKKRHKAIAAAAGWCRRMGHTRDEAIPFIRDVFNRFEGDKYTWEQVLGKLDDIYDRYDAGYRGDQLDPTWVDPPDTRPALNVTNDAEAAEWLARQIGAGKLSGLFARGDRIVYTPHEGEDGYRELTNAPSDDDGPAQVRPAKPILVARIVDRNYACYRTTTTRSGKSKDVPALFPKSATDRICATTDGLDKLRHLHGVIHTPVFRPDGSLITQPGYDPTTRLLYLPEPGLRLLPIPEHPTAVQLSSAVAVINEMIGEFPFVTTHDRANYLGLLITPLLRAIVGPPYKLGAMEAHQRGSGKTLLANMIRHIHGGVFRGEMPEDDAELRKQISTILDVTTGPVIVIDNVSGTLSSSTLASLLTAARWDDRKLGTMSEMISRPNDRLWLITGNNLMIGGDLPRRTLRCTIDPGMPQPETRTDFKIPDLESWVHHHRGDLLSALLTIVRAWVAAGRPLGSRITSDSYSTWQRTVAGILSNAGIVGTFDHQDTQIAIATDDEDWIEFLAAIHRGWGTSPWTCKELLDEANKPQVTSNGQVPPPRLSVDDLPSDFTKTGSFGTSVVNINTRSIGKWMANRRGRWAGIYTVREAGTHAGVHRWKVEVARQQGTR